MILARAPQPHEAPPPAAALRIAAGRPLRPVWLNGLGGLTFEIVDPVAPSFIKFAPAGADLPLAEEAERLAWAARYTALPRMIELGEDTTGTWLHTAALPGDNAVTERWKADSAPAVAAIGQGLRALHDALPVEDCPFSWSVEDRLVRARGGVAAGWYDPADWRDEFHGLAPAKALARAERPPDVDHLVVCHGDACAPNTLVGDDGRWTGHVDLGALGVADRWADLAVAAWSLEWNFGPGWEPAFYAAYGVAPDPERIAYYRLLWCF